MASAFKVLSVPRCCRSRCLGRCPGGKCCRLRSFSALPLGRRTAAGKGCRMRREWEPEDLLACWTLMDPDRAVAGEQGRCDAVGVRRVAEVLRAGGPLSPPRRGSAAGRGGLPGAAGGGLSLIH